jgi:hypothetical protein
MYLLTTELDSFDTLPVPSRVIILRRYLDALASADIEYLKNHPNTPSIYEWAPQYKIKPRPFVPGINEQADIWQDIPSVLRRCSGDCKDFSAYRLAELFMAGYKPLGFHIKVQQLADLIVYHIQVEGYDKKGRFFREDPSKLLGMPTIVSQDQLQQILNG